MTELNEFFDVNDGLVIAVTTSNDTKLVGFFDIDLSEVYINDNIRDRSAQFVCQEFEGNHSEIGGSVVISGTTYRINNATPDGTGLLVYKLLSEG